MTAIYSINGLSSALLISCYYCNHITKLALLLIVLKEGIVGFKNMLYGSRHDFLNHSKTNNINLLSLVTKAVELQVFVGGLWSGQVEVRSGAWLLL